jgi:hypothetical protein
MPGSYFAYYVARPVSGHPAYEVSRRITVNTVEEPAAPVVSEAVETFPEDVPADEDSEDDPYEYMCQRYRENNEKWGDWSDPVLWSHWGEDGKDGDGVEYVYYVTNGTPPKFALHSDVEIDSEKYQASEYKPLVLMPIRDSH